MISNRVRSLSIVLDDVKVALPRRDLTSKQRKELVDILSGCYNILESLNKTLDKYEELKSGCNMRDGQSRSFQSKVQRQWKRLRWEPDDIQEFRGRITSNTLLLSAFNGQLLR